MSQNVAEKKLTPKQRRVIEALVFSASISDAARAAGCARRTINRWMKQQHFRAALREVEAEAMRHLARTMAGLGEQAAAALRDALAEDQDIRVRLRAADLVLNRAVTLHELTSVLDRLERLEEMVDEQR